MTDQEEQEHQPIKGPRINKGLVIINTGDGKGKTTAALGLMFRAWGRGMNVRAFQFIKHTGSKFGEARCGTLLLTLPRYRAEGSTRKTRA